MPGTGPPAPGRLRAVGGPETEETGQGRVTGPRALGWATDLEVLPADREVNRAADHWVVRSPSNPQHWWGNFLLFDAPPRTGDGERWDGLFAAAFPGLAHRAFAWDRTDGDEGEAVGEFVRRGFSLEASVGLSATPAQLRPHPRANRQVAIRALDPAGDAELWEGALAVQLADNAAGPEPIPNFTAFAQARQHDLRALFAAGRGAWYAAIDPAAGVVGGCGVVTTRVGGRFQSVDTHPAHRRRGICRRLVAEAAADAARRHHLPQLVIVAEAGYHALGIYESLGFVAREQLRGVSRPPS
jgi:ribosomal protein S18 acetylase RimI-like enzyme